MQEKSEKGFDFVKSTSMYHYKKLKKYWILCSMLNLSVNPKSMAKIRYSL